MQLRPVSVVSGLKKLGSKKKQGLSSVVNFVDDIAVTDVELLNGVSIVFPLLGFNLIFLNELKIAGNYAQEKNHGEPGYTPLVT